MLLREVSRCPPPPAVLADPGAVKAAVDLITYAERPLIVIGKGELKHYFQYDACALQVPEVNVECTGVRGVAFTNNGII